MYYYVYLKTVSVQRLLIQLIVRLRSERVVEVEIDAWTQNQTLSFTEYKSPTGHSNTNQFWVFSLVQRHT